MCAIFGMCTIGTPSCILKLNMKGRPYPALYVTMKIYSFNIQFQYLVSIYSFRVNPGGLGLYFLPFLDGDQGGVLGSFYRPTMWCCIKDSIYPISPPVLTHSSSVRLARHQQRCQTRSTLGYALKKGRKTKLHEHKSATKPSAVHTFLSMYHGGV